MRGLPPELIIAAKNGERKITLWGDQPDGNSLEAGGRLVHAESPYSFRLNWTPGETGTTVPMESEDYKGGTFLHLNEEGLPLLKRLFS
jgi:hypothetical protein